MADSSSSADIVGPFTHHFFGSNGSLSSGGGGGNAAPADPFTHHHQQQPAKKPRLGGAAARQQPLSLFLEVQWTSEEGDTRQSRLLLEAVGGVADLRGLFRQLLCGAFPSALPDYLTSPEYYKFAPAEEFACLPGDATAGTAFRLVASAGAWEATVAERGAGVRPDPLRRLLVTVAEFESEPIELSDGTEAIVNLVTYPMICVQKGFMDAALARLTAAAAEALPACRAGLNDEEASSGSGATRTSVLSL